MAIPDPVRRDWPADRAVLLVHGIGSAKQGDYDALETKLRDLLRPAKHPYAIYVLYYDYLNDWFAGKEQVRDLDQILRGELRKLQPATREWSAAVDLIGDIIWPVLLADARDAIQLAIRRQLQAMVDDARAAGISDAGDMRISIIAHSMGCFHTYETLHTLTRDPQSGFAPATSGLQFENVMFMASPAQMIGTLAGRIRALVPRAASLACLSPIAIPTERSAAGKDVPCVKRPITITGTLDPVGGYLFNNRWQAGYMDLSANPKALHIDDPQALLNIRSSSDLADVLTRSLREHARPDIGALSPHDWGGYIDRNRAKILEWLDGVPAPR